MNKRDVYRIKNEQILQSLVNDAEMEIIRYNKSKQIKSIEYTDETQRQHEKIIHELNKIPQQCYVNPLYYEDLIDE